VVPLEIDGKRQAVVSLEDITARKKAELEAIQLNESIAHTNMELKKILDDLARSQSQLLESQKLEQIGLLASGFAHNLKSPISGIKGYAQLLRIEQKESKELAMIIEEVEVLETIINNLMLKSRKEHENRKEYLNLNQLIQVELEFLKANLFFKHQVKTELSLDERIPSIYGVYVHFSQSIMNIIQNAIDAMYESKEKILNIQTRFDDQFIFIDIGDTGCGIPEKIRESIFDVFFTTKPTSLDRNGDEPIGTGLGLSNANYFIHHYGGSIEVTDRKPRGTLFTLKVPYRQEEKSNYINRILIVDDSESIVDVLTHICQDMGMEAYGANTGEKALKLYSEIRPRIIVCDLSLPGITGKEMMEKIRHENPWQKVVYITGYFNNPEFQEWLSKETRYMDQCAVMRKPFPLDNFKKVLQKMVHE
jgi:signal transduction histidine kinase